MKIEDTRLIDQQIREDCERLRNGRYKVPMIRYWLEVDLDTAQTDSQVEIDHEVLLLFAVQVPDNFTKAVVMIQDALSDAGRMASSNKASGDPIGRDVRRLLRERGLI